MDPVDSTLRDFCGCCIREFLKWSIKQTTPQQQEKSPVNSKSLFKRLYSLALHPNAFKRLGAALAFNHIYKEFRCVRFVRGKMCKIALETFNVILKSALMFKSMVGWLVDWLLGWLAFSVFQDRVSLCSPG